MATQELTRTPRSGYLMLIVAFGFLATAVAFVVTAARLDSPIYLVGFVAGMLLTILTVTGLFIVNPNDARVLVLFGSYKGSVRGNGFYWANPFLVKKKVTLRARNFNGEKLKVNDQAGNPIEIAAIVVWQVEDSFKALFDVDNFEHYVVVQSEAAVRHLAGAYPYDNLNDGHDEGLTLRGGAEAVSRVLEAELSERFERAGIRVIEARISHLAYAPEIAEAMLRRQQATAIVAARTQIVSGAVGMVEMALQQLAERGVVDLDADRRATMVSNLLVVLCSESHATPVVNAGTLYQ
jgi:regulator of protease activity HflC (stomatin/prohibitin superfamily)